MIFTSGGGFLTGLPAASLQAVFGLAVNKPREPHTPVPGWQGQALRIRKGAPPPHPRSWKDPEDAEAFAPSLTILVVLSETDPNSGQVRDPILSGLALGPLLRPFPVESLGSCGFFSILTSCGPATATSPSRYFPGPPQASPLPGSLP